MTTCQLTRQDSCYRRARLSRSKVLYSPTSSGDTVKALIELLSKTATVTCFEQAVAFAVIQDAIYDLVKPARFDGDMRRAKAVQWWILGYDEGWCAVIGLDSEWTLELLHKAGLL